MYGATFSQAVKRFFLRGFKFKGMASRSEYWWAVFFQFLIAVGLGVLYQVFGYSADPDAAEAAANGGTIMITILINIAWVIMIIPNLSLHWRRLHDAGFAGPCFFLNFIPVVGSIIVLVLVLLPTDTAKQKAIWEDPARVTAL